MSTTKLNFGLDALIGLAFMFVLFSGLAQQAGRTANEFHVWASLSLSIGIVAHLVLHRKWLAATSRPGEKSGQMKTSIWLNRLLGIGWLCALLTGLHGHLDRVSGDPAHVLAAASMTGILLIHLARHWKWVVTTTKSYWE